MGQSTKRPVWSLAGDSQPLRLLAITLLIFVGFSLVLGDKFFSIRNLQSMAVQFPEFGILAFAIMITMLTGGIDLSIVGTANLSAIAAALLLTRLSGEGGAGLALELSIPLAMVAALAVASACGLLSSSFCRSASSRCISGDISPAAGAPAPMPVCIRMPPSATTAVPLVSSGVGTETSFHELPACTISPMEMSSSFSPFCT